MRAFFLLLGAFAVIPATLLAQGQQPPQCPRTSSRINLQSGSFSTQPGVTFDLHPFVAHLVPMARTAPGCYQALTVVQHARIFTSNGSLTALFAAKLKQSDSKLHDLKIVNGDGVVSLSGTMRELVPVHFHVEGPVSTDGTAIRVDVTSINADGIPIKLVLETLGKHLNSLFGSIAVPGIVIEGNAMLFRPEYLAHLKGHILSAVSTPAGLTLTYGPELTAAAPAPSLPRP